MTPVLLKIVVCNDFTTSDGWLKLVLKTLVYKGGLVNSSGYRDMEVSTKTNTCRRGFWCSFFMEMPYGSVND